MEKITYLKKFRKDVEIIVINEIGDIDTPELWHEIHNGFFYYPSRMMGFESLDEVTRFSDDEWGIIDELEEPLQISLDTTYGFYNSGGGYLAVDYSNCENNVATRWYDVIDPDYNIDFWKFADEWIMNGFE